MISYLSQAMKLKHFDRDKVNNPQPVKGPARDEQAVGHPPRSGYGVIALAAHKADRNRPAYFPCLRTGEKKL